MRRLGRRVSLVGGNWLGFHRRCIEQKRIIVNIEILITVSLPPFHSLPRTRGSPRTAARQGGRSGGRVGADPGLPKKPRRVRPAAFMMSAEGFDHDARSSDTDRRNQDWHVQACGTESGKPFAAMLDGTDQADRVKKRRLCIHLYRGRAIFLTRCTWAIPSSPSSGMRGRPGSRRCWRSAHSSEARLARNRASVHYWNTDIRHLGNTMKTHADVGALVR